MSAREIDFQVERGIQLAQYRVQWQDLVLGVVELSCSTISELKTVLHYDILESIILATHWCR